MSNTSKKRSITFDVNDTLLFKNGQEILEMLSISLDPDIIVQSYDEYVQIRGLILLQGEYEREVTNKGEIDAVDGTIEKVIETDNNKALFSHRFPVDISVSSERVKSLNDLVVTVDAFDYTLPNPNTLKIAAVIQVNGIDAEKAEVKANQDLVSLPKQEEPEKNEITEKTPKNEKQQVADQQVETEKKQEKVIAEVDEQTTEEKENIEEVEVKETVTEASETKETAVEKTAQAAVNDIDIQLHESEQEQDVDEVKDVQFLTELFDHENEENYKKIRLYIIQSDDTIESIAQQYDISTLELLKENNLTSESLSEGKLLNIPVK